MIEKLNEIKKMDLECGVFSVYDMDGKTTQEIFNQFFTKINKVIDVSNASITLIEYLVDEGIKVEIAEKLVEWVQDGTLKDIVENDVLAEINAKIDASMKDIQEQKDRVESVVFRLEEQFDFLKEKEGYNVKYYGAVGDGINDDTGAIKRAMYSAQADESNKTIYIPSGIYCISDSIEVPDGVTIIGDAQSVIKFMQSDITIKINAGVELNTLIIDANKKNTTKVISVLGSVSMLTTNVVLQNITIQNVKSASCVVIDCGVMQKSKIENCLFDNISASELTVIGLQSSMKNIIRNNKFQNILCETNNGYGIDVDSFNKGDTIIVQNVFDNIDVTANIITRKGFIASLADIVIKDNVFNIAFGRGANHATIIEGTKEVKIKNNIYMLSDEFNYMYPIIKTENAKNIQIDGEIVQIGMSMQEPSISNPDRAIFKFISSDVTMTNMTVSGLYHSDTMFEMHNSNVKVLKSIIDTTTMNVGGRVNTLFKAVESNIEIMDNNISLTKSDVIVDAKDCSKLRIKNNIISRMSAVNSDARKAVKAVGCKEIIAEENEFDSELHLEDMTSATIRRNTITRIYVKSNHYDIISEQNRFIGRDRACYELPMNEGSGKCKLLSRNNYNVSNHRMILFYTDSYMIDASNVDIKTVDDMNSDDVQKLKNEYISKDSEITKDIFRSCYVQTTQEHPRITWFNYENPKIDVRRPNGATVYDAVSGKIYMNVVCKGLERLILL